MSILIDIVVSGRFLILFSCISPDSKVGTFDLHAVSCFCSDFVENRVLVPICLLLVPFGSDRAHFGSIFGLGSILSKKRS